MTGLLIVSAVLFGLATGSFLNVVIYRVPLKRSIVAPPSACPGCGQGIANRDNIPVVSWLLLRGKCRNCGTSISARYPFVESLTAALYVLIVLRFGWSWTLPAEVVLVTGLVTLAFIDFDHMLLPRRIVYLVGAGVAAGLVVAASAQGSWHRLGIAALCGLAEFVLFFTIHFASPRAMGFGDVRLAPVIALALGWIGWRYAFWGFFLANLIGALVGVTLMAMGRAGRKTQVPFGVFLSAGAVLAIAVAGAINYPA